jgi:hypothetical protein
MTDEEQLRNSGRTFVIHKGRFLIFRSEHPLEERLIELTDDYRDADGHFILPELVAWDGVETCPGIGIHATEADA